MKKHQSATQGRPAQGRPAQGRPAQGRPAQGRLAQVLMLVLLAVSLAPTPGLVEASRVSSDGVATDLPTRYVEWLELVEVLINEEERAYFLSLDRDYRRDAFIERFWAVRDPQSRTRTNELKRNWFERADTAKQDFGSLLDARAMLLLLNGEPGRIVLPDGREVSRCFDRDREMEIWFYGGSEQTLERFVVVVMRPQGARDRPYEAWRPSWPLRSRQRSELPTTDIRKFCDETMRGLAFGMIRSHATYDQFLDEILAPPEPPEEWVATFASFTATVPENAETLEVDINFGFPGRNQNRTAVQGILQVPTQGTGTLPVDGKPMIHLLLTGEVVRQDQLFETFRYRFELSLTPGGDEMIPVVFQRYLRPGPVQLVLKLEDLYGKRFALVERDLEVPPVADLPSLRPSPDSHLFLPWVEANEAARRGETTIRIVPPAQDRTVQVGYVRFDTVTAGEIAQVTFYLNDKRLMTKRRPPFSLDLDLGATAASHRLRVVAATAAGEEVASDELLVNQGGQRFRVRLVEPRADRLYSESLSAVGQVEIPDGQELDRLEIYLGERRVATLYQPPFVQAIRLGEPGLSYVRAVAYLQDGNSTEDVVFVNAPDYLEEVEVQYVELYASVTDARRRPLLGLGAESFAVDEDGLQQEIRRFEWVQDLPIHAGLLLDTSASMADSLDSVAAAALSFVEQTIRAKDRVALLSFNERPTVEVKFTNHKDRVAQALAGLRAEGGTSLYDSLVFALHYFDGMRGQRALLLLSDGKDESSHFDFEGALEVARRAGVTVYVIGLKKASERASRKVLSQFADETGGRSFFLQDLDELPEIYASIQQELRSQYLIAYQSTSTKDPAEFRLIKVELVGLDGEVRTMSGYYP